ncbi:hypothetical protein JWH04_16295 [Xanthomonas melonis]|uniref:hypothetical protein n=1 Tax=Xanthomonas melonis TaxID=56456 RepID=UPI001E49411C|nr:hypothetical protein [Xanthomonas melonis]MCD0280471.1 hypothetical protein [Xanthomonas melonis]
MSGVQLLPAWRNAAAELFNGQYAYGEVIPHRVLRAALRLPEPRGKLTREEWERWRLDLVAQVDALADWLLEEKNICLKAMHGEGYMLVRPGDQTEFAVKQGRKKIRAELRRMGRRLSFIDHASLSQEQRKANADALARLSFMEQQFRKARRRTLFDPPPKAIGRRE